MADINLKRNTDNQKKQLPLRLSTSLFRELSAWAEDDFRSINGQIEYLLTECVRQRRKNRNFVPRDIGKKAEIPDDMSGQ